MQSRTQAEKNNAGVLIHRLTVDEWRIFAEDAHLAVFNERRIHTLDRVDYALLGTTADSATVLGYATVSELDSESVYLQHGGVFEKGFKSWQLYTSMLDTVRKDYKRVFTRVENINTVYIKMAIKAGFKIIGTRTFQGSVLVEFYMEFN
jgi:RimJ/RimL family protein N-acetyltransferase